MTTIQKQPSQIDIRTQGNRQDSPEIAFQNTLKATPVVTAPAPAASKPFPEAGTITDLMIDSKKVGTIVWGAQPQNAVVRLLDTTNPETANVEQEARRCAYGAEVGATELILDDPALSGPALDAAVASYIETVKSYQPKFLKKYGQKLACLVEEGHGIPGGFGEKHANGTKSVYTLGDKQQITDTTPGINGSNPPYTTTNLGRYAQTLVMDNCYLLANQATQEESYAYFNAMQAYANRHKCTIIAHRTHSLITWQNTELEFGDKTITLEKHGPGGNSVAFRPHKSPIFVRTIDDEFTRNVHNLPYNHITQYVAEKTKTHGLFNKTVRHYEYDDNRDGEYLRLKKHPASENFDQNILTEAYQGLKSILKINPHE